MRAMIIRKLIFIAFTYSIFGCATYWQVKTVENNLTTLQDQTIELNQKNVLLQKELSSLKKHVNNIDEYTQQTKIELTTQLELLEGQLNSLNYKLDDINSRLSYFFQRFDHQSIQNTNANSDSLKQSFEKYSGKTQQLSDVNASLLYKNAKLDLVQGRYLMAIQGFDEYINRFPESEFADDACYNIGEAYYAQGSYKKALEEFAKVINNYSQSEYEPAALLKMGYCYLELGDSEIGKHYLEKLIIIYPSTNECGLAQARLSGEQ